jgi:hypothetical protein
MENLKNYQSNAKRNYDTYSGINTNKFYDTIINVLADHENRLVELKSRPASSSGICRLAAEESKIELAQEPPSAEEVELRSKHEEMLTELIACENNLKFVNKDTVTELLVRFMNLYLSKKI